MLRFTGMIFSTDAESIIERLKAGGADNLHIIADFDRTITPNKVNGEKTSASFAQFRNGGYLSETYRQEAEKLFEHYYPIEVDATIDESEKRAAMKEWWQKHMQLFVDEKVTLDIITEVASTRLKLRENAKDFFGIIHQNQIPLLIFSAGVGDLIRIHLESKNLITENVHIISNFFEFKDGIAIGTKEPVVAAASKDEAAVTETPFASEIIERRNAILMGDKIEDLQMSHGIEHDALLTIGFLNENDPVVRDAFLANFDIVIEGDGSLESVNELLKSIIS